MALAPLNYNNYNNYSNYNNFSKKPAFTSKAPKIQNAEEIISKAANQESSLFAPFRKKYDAFTDYIADKFTSRLVNFEPLTGLADKLKDTKNLFQHCLTVGSVVTSGLYMQRTYTNKDLDKDRRNTLVVNQGLTLVASTIGAYALDKYIKGWWENVTARFAGHLLNDQDFYTNFVKQKDVIKAENEKLKAQKAELKPLPNLEKLIKKHSYFKSLNSDNATSLMNKVKGMGLLRTMIVFGFVYRYFVPVAVTKPANKLCDMYLQKKKEQNTQKA